MEPLVLTDKDRFPTDEVVASHVGSRMALWNAFFDQLRADHPDIEVRWRYYNDGKNWLMNASRKKKTVFWLGVFKGGFRVTCYFTDRAAGAIRTSALSDGLKEQFLGGKRYGKLGAVTITFTKKADLKDAATLIALKLL